MARYDRTLAVLGVSLVFLCMMHHVYGASSALQSNHHHRVRRDDNQRNCTGDSSLSVSSLISLILNLIEEPLKMLLPGAGGVINILRRILSGDLGGLSDLVNGLFQGVGSLLHLPADLVSRIGTIGVNVIKCVLAGQGS